MSEVGTSLPEISPMVPVVLSPLPHPLSLVARPSRDLLVSLLQLLQSRMAWSSAKPFLVKAGVHASRGWDETISTASVALYSEPMLAAACSLLTDVALKHSAVGNKNAYFFDLKQQEEKKKNSFLEWARNKAELDLEPTLQQRAFGIFEMPTTQKGLAIIKNNEPFLFSVEKHGGKVFFQFFSVRSYSKRVKIKLKELTKTQQKAFSIYEELYGIEKSFVPCFDTVVVDLDSEILEFRIDFAPDMVGDTEISPFTKAVNTFDQVVIRFNKDPITASAPLINLFPAIKPMYEDEACGKVTALGFVAIGKDASSNNQGKIQRSLTRDFRKDPFHVGGKGNVTKIEPYAIGLHWGTRKSADPLSLEIKGSSRAVFAGKGGSAFSAEMVGCLDENDFQFLKGQVLQRIDSKI